MKTASSNVPRHRADLAGSKAYRTMLSRYLEVIGGVLLGLAMWVIDAVTNLPGESPWSLRLFLAQLVWPSPMTMIFRAAFLAFAIVIGWAVWRRNLKKEATERQKRERAVASERLRTRLAIVNTFRREMNGPLSHIAENAQMLSNQPRSAMDHERLERISQTALSITAFIEHLANAPPMYLVDNAGVERIVPHEPFELSK